MFENLIIGINLSFELIDSMYQLSIDHDPENPGSNGEGLSREYDQVGILALLDAADPEDQSLIMDEYDDASDELTQALKQQIETVSTEPYQDEWGDHISVYVPFFDKNKKMAGTLGIDINALHYVERLAPIKIAAQRAAVGSFVISFFFGLAVWFLRNFSKQMNASRQGISKDFAAFSKKEGNDE